MPVIRPFALADILLVYRLQRSGVPLAIEHNLTHPRPPLWLALTAPWPWAGLGVATYVLRERSRGPALNGFVQLLKRSSRPEADLLYLAPSLGGEDSEDARAEMTWLRLLQHCSAEAGRRGLQRIFASVPDGGPELGRLREAGYSLYTRETIYRLSAAAPARPALPGFRLQRPIDGWALQRLYTRSTPCLVQQAEGAMAGEAGSPPLSWWEPDRWHGIVWAPAGEICGAVQVHVGRAGHWLRVWGASALTSREVRNLVEQGLRVLAMARTRLSAGPLPVFVTVRDYEAGLSGALVSFGFVPYVDRVRLVKHTVAMRRVLMPAAQPAREIPQKVLARSQAHIDVLHTPQQEVS